MQRSIAYFLALALVAAFVRLAPSAETEKSGPAATPEFSKEQIEFFEKDVQPILKARCLKCHGADEEKIKGGFRLTSRSAILSGGDQGPAVDLEEPADSLLVQAINYDGLEMPPGGRLPKNEVEILTRWVKDGLPWTPGEDKPAEQKPRKASLVVDDAARSYWAYRPLKRPEPPAVKNAGWVRNPIDAFVLTKLEAKGLAPAPPADRAALIRRVYYDLTGLPPRPEEVDAFVADKSQGAYERLIDRLLDSPQYGEKWGRHWLDLVRYAETHGYERDSAKPFAWRYRDYVIGSFNSDKPYDRFLREQLAGDELDAVTPETMIATGFYRLGIWDDEPADRALAKYDVLDGIVSTTGQVVLGMTLGCARCHDHKKDPIPQRDYYKFLAFFRDVTDMNVANIRRVATDDDRAALAQLLREKQEREGELYSQLFEIEQRFAAALVEKHGPRVSRRTPDLVDLSYRFYRDTWDRLPEFDSLKPEASGVLPQGFFTLAPASRNEAIGLVFEGKLIVPQAGEYAFSVEATEAARLIVDGKVVLEKSERGRPAGEGRVTLPKGLVPIRLEYFNATRKPELNVAWSGPGFESRSLSDGNAGSVGQSLVADSRKDAQEWSYTVAAPPADWMQPDFAADAWSRGPGGFGTRGTPGAVVRTVWRTPDIWLRKTFRVEQIPSRLALLFHHDDQAEVYLNGQPIHRVGGYTVDYQTIVLPEEAAAALKTGDNLLAIHCHQTIGGQYIDAGLFEPSERDVLVDVLRRRGRELLGADSAEQYARLAAQLEESRKAPPPEPGIEVMCVEERGREPTHVLIRGNPGAPGDKVGHGFPEVLCAPSASGGRQPPEQSPLNGTNETSETPGPHPRPLPQGEGERAHKRRALAEWLTSPENPLTARVLANRLWQHHFGRGIVPTPNDFGQLGEPPTHPELLDWLAAEVMNGGWRLKRMHKLILLSNAYQMSSQANEQALRDDPGNTLFWRFNMRRLSAEEVRDSILAVSGKLNLKAGGPSVYPPIPKAVLAGQSVPGQGWGKSSPEDASRRSVYVHVKRSLLVPILSTHDQADTDSSCPVRYTTTVPTQSLGMLNGEFTNEQAAFFAERLERETTNDVREQIRRAIRLTTGRQPGDDEISRDAELLRDLQTSGKLDAHAALTKYCLLLLNANEFVYLD